MNLIKSHLIYLDNNATTPVAPAVVTSMHKCLRECYGNPSSTHSAGKKARTAVDRARRNVADLINAAPDEIFFTSGGTESNNLAILGTASRLLKGHIITSCIEHPSVMNPVRHLEKKGYNVSFIPVNRDGIVDAASVEELIRKDTILISVMHSNNETGSIQPISEIGEVAKRYNIVFHCDAAQSVGKVPVNVKRLNVDLLTIVSHKFYGPKGVGALYIKSGTEINPIMYGASHERGLRPGTENTCSIAGLGKACETAKRDLHKRTLKMKSLSAILYKELKLNIPGIKLNGHPSRRLPNTLNLSFPGISAIHLLNRISGKIAASTGSACHEGTHTPSPVLKAMGIEDSRALSALRISLGIYNSENQIRSAARILTMAYRELLAKHALQR